MPTTEKRTAVRTVSTGGDFAVSWGPKSPLALMAGPCVIESRAHCLGLARRLAALADRLGIPLVFKASFDKANRSSLEGYRGPGIDAGLDILAEVREETGLPVLTDIHEPWQAERCAKAGIDVIQIPAFLCRQTDLLLAAGETGRVVNVKKMQGMAPEAMAQVVRKIESTGNRRIVLTERGESFGYGVRRRLPRDARDARQGALRRRQLHRALRRRPALEAARLHRRGRARRARAARRARPGAEGAEGRRPMRRRALLPALLALAALAGGALAQLDVAATGDQRVSNLRLPLQRHPNGRVKELFLAKEGEMTPDGRFVVDGGILVLLLDEDGATNGVGRGVRGWYDRASNRAECIGPVSLELRTKGVLLEGTNMVWDSAENLLAIRTNAVLTLSRGGKSAVEALQR